MEHKVDAQHPAYSARAKRWEKIRDAIEGEDAIKKGGTKYVPKLSEQSDDEYESYKTRALWYGATDRTVSGLCGLVFRKSPKFDEIDEKLLENVTLSGVPLEAFAKEVLSEVISMGRHGVYVDQPSKAGDNNRPYLVRYQAEQIINWRTVNVGGVPKLSMVILSEDSQEEEAGNRYGTVDVQRIRELFLDDSGLFAVQIWKKEGKEWIRERDPFLPSIRGKRLDYIPFTFFGVAVRISRRWVSTSTSTRFPVVYENTCIGPLPDIRFNSRPLAFCNSSNAVAKALKTRLRKPYSCASKSFCSASHFSVRSRSRSDMSAPCLADLLIQSSMLYSSTTR